VLWFGIGNNNATIAAFSGFKLKFTARLLHFSKYLSEESWAT
jgi:hypothetical protein